MRKLSNVISISYVPRYWRSIFYWSIKRVLSREIGGKKKRAKGLAYVPVRFKLFAPRFYLSFLRLWFARGNVTPVSCYFWNCR